MSKTKENRRKAKVDKSNKRRKFLANQHLNESKGLNFLKEKPVIND